MPVRGDGGVLLIGDTGLFQTAKGRLADAGLGTIITAASLEDAKYALGRLRFDVVAVWLPRFFLKQRQQKLNIELGALRRLAELRADEGGPASRFILAADDKDFFAIPRRMMHRCILTADDPVFADFLAETLMDGMGGLSLRSQPDPADALLAPYAKYAQHLIPLFCHFAQSDRSGEVVAFEGMTRAGKSKKKRHAVRGDAYCSIQHENGVIISAASAAGCGRCKFCCSQYRRRTRNLTHREILAQFWHGANTPLARRTIRRGGWLEFSMSCEGDAMVDNLDQFAMAAELLGPLKTPPVNLKITCSTIGGLAAFRRYRERYSRLKVHLDWSLHFLDPDERRREIRHEDAGRIYEMRDLIQKIYGEGGFASIDLNYSVVSGENDRPEDMEKLAVFVAKTDFGCKLMPRMQYSPLVMDRVPGPERLERLASTLKGLGARARACLIPGYRARAGCGSTTPVTEPI